MACDAARRGDWAGRLGHGSYGTHGRERFLLAALVYVPLVALAVAAQLDAASHAGLWRQFFVALDAGAAGGLMALMLRRI